jgi:hypothetical protein
VGHTQRLRFGLPFDGAKPVIARNAKLYSDAGTIKAYLDDTTLDGMAMMFDGTQMKFYSFASGSGPITGSQFGLWNTDGIQVGALGLTVSGSAVVKTRKTGWAVATGTATRTTFDTATVTTAQLAERVKALIDDLHATAGHGLLGT